MAVSGGIIGPTMRKWIPLLALIALLAACAPVADDLITITLIADGEKRSFDTSAVTVRDVLSETATTIGEYDRVTPVEHTLVENGMTIRVTRVEIQIEKVRQDIPFERRTVRDASVPEGQTRLLEPGVTGIEELTYRVTFEDSVQVSRQLIQEVTTLEPRTEVILIGARAEIKPVPITGTVAYIADRNAWVMIENSADRHRRTFSGDLDGRVFAASPGGTHLLFTRSTTETGASAPINTLWLIEAATSEAEPIRLMAENVLWAEWEPGCTVKETGTGCRISGRPTHSIRSCRRGRRRHHVQRVPDCAGAVCPVPYVRALDLDTNRKLVARRRLHTDHAARAGPDRGIPRRQSGIRRVGIGSQRQFDS